MDWFQVLTIAGSTIGACWFMHRENVKMYRDFDREMRDFHGRLCTLEERYLHLMEKRFDIK